MHDVQRIIAELTNMVASKAAAKAAQHVLAERPILQRFLATKDVSVYLGMSVDTLQLWRGQGIGPTCRRVHRSIRYDVRELDKWMAGLVPGLDGTFVGQPMKEGVQEQQEVKR